MRLLLQAVYAALTVGILAACCGASAIWSVEGTDTLGRVFGGTIELFDDHADLSLMYDGEDGITLFDNSFARFEESPATPQIVLLQDFEGLKGGQLSLIGDRILSSQIEIGTDPVLTGGSIIVADGFSGFFSAGNISSTTRESVSVPEAAGITGMFCGAIFLLMAYGVRQ